MKDEQNKDTGLNQEDTATEQETANEEQSQSTLPKTQEELDAVVEARVAREKKKWMRGAQKQTAAQQTTPAQAKVQNAQEDAKQPTGPDPALVKVQRDLIAAQMQLEAIRNNFRADVAADAVYLAMRAVELDGDDVDEESMKDALDEVKKRHPEWVVDDKSRGGFKVGADPKRKDDPTQTKALPTGTVIM